MWLVPAGVAGCGSTAPSPRTAESYTEEGVASFYAHRFHGRETAYGETYDERALTAAHRSLPHGTRVRVTNLKNGREVVVRINDRGPVSQKRLIDLSFAAAEKLQFVRQGLTRVRIEVLARAD
jgi:peptidoglycan lytic transglycosylase